MVVNEAIYVFRGHPFIEYIDEYKFKNDISSILNIPDETMGLPFPSYYTELMSTFSDSIESIRKTFFENILYSHLKNIYLDKIKSHPNLEVPEFKSNIKQLIKKINHKDSIPPSYYNAMNENGFYLMDLLNISVPNASFIAGYDYEEKGGFVTNARFLYVEVIPNKSSGVTYFISGIDIDFIRGISLTMIKNVDGLKKDDDDTNTTVNQLRISAIHKIFNKLDVQLYHPRLERDRNNMFDFCKELDDKLLGEIRKELNLRTRNAVRNSVNLLSSDLFGNDNKLTNTDKDDLKKKITAILLGYYVDYNLNSSTLVKKAKEIKLVGYPTRINFASDRNGKSSTQSANAKHPVSGSDMFHSLYFNFEQAIGLDRWTISWFTDFQFKDEDDTDVIGTTIYSTSKNFRVIFRPTRALDKEMIHYVIRTIDSYR